MAIASIPTSALVTVADKVGIPFAVIVLLSMLILPKIDEGIAIAQHVDQLMTLEQTVGVVCRPSTVGQ